MSGARQIEKQKGQQTTGFVRSLFKKYLDYEQVSKKIALKGKDQGCCYVYFTNIYLA